MKPIIKTVHENAIALSFVERLMENDPEKDSKKGMLLSLLSDQIQIFEKRYDRADMKRRAEGVAVDN